MYYVKIFCAEGGGFESDQRPSVEIVRKSGPFFKIDFFARFICLQLFSDNNNSSQFPRDDEHDAEA